MLFECFYSTDITRDSYGNVVTPYDQLPAITNPTGQEQQPPAHNGVGFWTDVNRDKTHHGNSPSASGTTLQFAIPSYADGITQLQGKYDDKITFNSPPAANTNVKVPVQSLLPPLSSGNYNYPSLGATIPSYNIPNVVPTAAASLPDNSYQNEVTGKLPGKDTSSETALAFDELASQGNFLLPPKFPASSFNIGSNVYSTQVPAFANFAGPTSTAFVQPPKYDQIPVQIQTIAPTDSGKYTGGFGGAPGVLGQQKPGVLLPGKQTVASGSHASSGQIQQPPLTGIT